VPLRLVLIEDSEDDALLLMLELRQGGFDLDFVRVETPEELESALEAKTWDAVIADYNLPAFSGLDALRIIQARGLDLPFILVSGVIGEEKAVDAMKAGAHDFIVKGNYTRLAPALERELRDAEVRRERRQTVENLHRAHDELEIRVQERTAELARYNEALRTEMSERKRSEDALRESEEQLQLFIEHAPAALAMFDTDMRYLSVSRRWLNDYGLGERVLIGESHYDVFPEITAEWRVAHHRGLAGEVLRGEADRFERADGSVQWVRWEIRPWYDAGGEIGGIVIFAEDITDIKRSEEKLRNSENKFSIMFSKASLPAVLSRFPDHEFVDVNDAWTHLFGYTKEESIGKTSFELGVNRDTVRRTHTIVEVRRHKQVHNFEQTLFSKSGESLTILTNVNMIEIDGQEYALTSMQDITARNKAEDELRASEEKFSTMFRTVPIAIALSTLSDGALYDINPAWLDLTGFTRKEEVIGKTSLELGLIGDAAQRESILNKFRQNGFVRNVELTFSTRKGIQRTVLVNLNRVEIGRCSFILSAMEEITERKRAEEALRLANENLELRVRERTEELSTALDNLSGAMAERQRTEKLLRLSEERYRKVVEDQTELICRFTADGMFTFVNDVYCRVFGKTSDELLGNRWQPKAFPDDVPVIEKQLRTMSPSNPVVVIENRAYSGSGEIRWMQFVNRGFFDEQGRIIETQAVGRDITERKIIEEKLLAANSTMNRLVRTIAHEFRTPLGLLTGSTDILDRYWDRLTQEKRLEQNEHIRNAARQISNLVSSVTSFQLSGTDSHVHPPLLQDIGDICRSIAAEVETVWGAGHEFIVSIASDCGFALMDVILLRRILQNLLTNAFRYTLSTGTVSLRVCREKNLLLLEITDTGIGIPEEEQALIFDAFYRSRNVEGRRGLGLGLSIVREALLQMGGTIKVTSRIGKGTTMRVEIPLPDP
jgi:PAS domain S-box-containing protein